jgi:KaiC/GvpD/RAD55 family RecA-like ATPase
MEHSLCLLEGESSFPALYDMINQYLSEGYAVIYSVENDPTRVLMQMTRLGIRAENLIQNGSLKLVDKSVFFPSDKIGHNKELLDSWQSLISSLKNFKWVLCIGSNDVFLEADKREELLDYEKTLAVSGMSIEIVCCYNTNLMANLCLAYLIKILNLHQFTLHHHHSQFVYHEWRPSKIVELLARSMNKALGEESSYRLLNILKMVYKIDDLTTSKDMNFEDPIRELLGDSAKIILNNLVEEIKKDITFTRTKSF